MRCLLTMILLLAVGLPARAESPGIEFNLANQEFLAGDFEASYSGYEGLLDDGHLNADLLFNIGNASYRLDRPGESALWFARTLKLDPTHKEARQNLRFLRRTSGFHQFQDADHVGFLNFARRDTFLRVAVFSGWLGILAIAATLTLRFGSGPRAVLWTIGPVATLVAIAAGVGLHLKNQERADLKKLHVVTEAETSAHTSPVRSSGNVIALPPGSQLSLVSARGDWDYVDIPGDLRGWIRRDARKPLWPYDEGLAD